MFIDFPGSTHGLEVFGDPRDDHTLDALHFVSDLVSDNGHDVYPDPFGDDTATGAAADSDPGSADPDVFMEHVEIIAASGVSPDYIVKLAQSAGLLVLPHEIAS